MAISLRAAGTATAATAAVTAVNPAVPTGATTGDLSVLTVWMKPFGTTITTPSGWDKIGEATNGTTAAGTDTGSTKIAVFVKVSAAVGAIGNLTLAGSPNSVGAVINTYQNGTGVWDVSQFTTGGDTTNAANYSATGAGGIAVAAGDWVSASTAVCGDIGTVSAQAIAGMSGATLDTVVNRTNAAVTTGTDTRGLVSDVPVSSGTSSAAPTFTYTNASSTSGTTLWLRVREAPAVLVIGNAAHAHTASEVALTQHQVLTIANAAHAHTVDNVTVTAHGPTLVIGNAAHAHTAGNVTLTQHQVLVIANAAHTQTATAPSLTQHQVLTIANSAHGQVAGNVTLTQHQVLAIANAAHAHTAEQLTLGTVPAVTLTIQGAAHAQAATEVALTQHQALGGIDSTNHGHTADTLTLTAHAAAGTALVIANAAHAHTAGHLTLIIPTGTWWEWNGLTLNPLTLEGEWDGNSIRPLTPNGVT